MTGSAALIIRRSLQESVTRREAAADLGGTAHMAAAARRVTAHAVLLNGTIHEGSLFGELMFPDVYFLLDPGERCMKTSDAEPRYLSVTGDASFR